VRPVMTSMKRNQGGRLGRAQGHPERRSRRVRAEHDSITRQTIGPHSSRSLHASNVSPRAPGSPVGSVDRWVNEAKLQQIADRYGIDDGMSDAITGHAPASVGRAYGAPNVEDMARELKKFPRWVETSSLAYVFPECP
jgi:hypothetical protein